MQKKIIVLAIAAALTAPAAFAADASNVTVYGKLSADFESVRTSAVALPATQATSVNRIATNASRFGVKGSEDLGDGLKAIYQYEVQVDLNGNAGNGFGNGTRNSHIGMQGDFGTAFLGIWDTPYKVSHNKVELFDNTTFGSATNVLGRTGTGANFNTRQRNSVQYWTPNMSGFQAKAAYSTGTIGAKTATVDPTLMALSATYENDMFYAAYGYQSLKDQGFAAAALAAGNKSSGNRLVGALKIENGQVGLTYERLSETVGVTTASRNAWELSGKYKMGANNFGLSYTSAGNLGAAVASGAKQLSVRYAYSFSKRTELYGMYTSLSNDTAANYNFSAGNTIAGSAVGAKLSGFGVGMVHSF